MVEVVLWKAAGAAVVVVMGKEYRGAGDDGAAAKAEGAARAGSLGPPPLA